MAYEFDAPCAAGCGRLLRSHEGHVDTLCSVCAGGDWAAEEDSYDDVFDAALDSCVVESDSRDIIGAVAHAVTARADHDRHRREAARELLEDAFGTGFWFPGAAADMVSGDALSGGLAYRLE